MNLLQRSLIEKAGHDHGFEHVVASEPDGVLLASARHAASAQVITQPAGGYLLRLHTETPALLPEMKPFISPAESNRWLFRQYDSELGNFASAAPLVWRVPCRAKLQTTMRRQ